MAKGARAMTGSAQRDYAATKLWLHQSLKRLAGASPDRAPSIISDVFSADASCFVAHPINELEGAPEIERKIQQHDRGDDNDKQNLAQRQKLLPVGCADGEMPRASANSR